MKHTTEQDYRDRVLRVIDHIGDHLDEPLDLETLAGVASFSAYHFHRVFRSMVGETLADYIRRRRLEAAGQALRRGESVLTVALDAGYDSPEAFARAFKAHYGLPPSRFASAEPAPDPWTNGCGLPRGEDGLLLIPHSSLRRASMKVDIVTLQETPIAFVSHQGPYSAEAIDPAFERIVGWAVLNGHMNRKTLTLGRFYDDPDSVPADRLRAEACVTVREGVTVSTGIEHGTIGAGIYAKTVFKGPIADCVQAYEFVFGDWLPKSGREAGDGPCMEVYVSDPDTPPEKTITELYVPLKA